MKSLKTSITIEAAPSVVWDILMDFEAYPDWNPFIKNSLPPDKISLFIIITSSKS